MFSNTDLYPTLAEQAREDAMKKAVQEALDRPIKGREKQAVALAEFRRKTARTRAKK